MACEAPSGLVEPNHREPTDGRLTEKVGSVDDRLLRILFTAVMASGFGLTGDVFVVKKKRWAVFISSSERERERGGIFFDLLSDCFFS